MIEDSWITLVDDNGEAIDVYLLEETKINDITYILTTNGAEKEEETEFYILKDLSAPEDEEALYEIVEDEEEWDAVADIFEQLLDGEDVF